MALDPWEVLRKASDQIAEELVADRRRKEESGLTVDEFKLLLKRHGLRITTVTYGTPPHKFALTPNPRGGCAHCPYPENHSIHERVGEQK